VALGFLDEAFEILCLEDCERLFEVVERVCPRELDGALTNTFIRVFNNLLKKVPSTRPQFRANLLFFLSSRL
jgi:hypothetical protein